MKELFVVKFFSSTICGEGENKNIYTGTGKFFLVTSSGIN